MHHTMFRHYDVFVKAFDTFMAQVVIYNRMVVSISISSML